jgi:hypothetical protein
MPFPTVFVATWTDGLFLLDGESRRHELAGRSVRGIARDAHGEVLAIVDGHSLSRRGSDGQWTSVTTSDRHLACTAVVGDAIYVGTEDDAHVLRVPANGDIHQLDGFDTMAGRATWYAGSAIINGRVLGPPLGVRSMTVTADGAALLANVHVGGIPRSTDGGVTWQPTIDVDCDVHEVRAHPHSPGIVIAATAKGLWLSRDGGANWSSERAGLHAGYCAAVAFSGNDLLVSASSDHFATESAVYRRPIDGPDSLERLGNGLPTWLDGIVDTSCMAANDHAVALSDKAGHLYVSTDAGCNWLLLADGLPQPSGVLIV